MILLCCLLLPLTACIIDTVPLPEFWPEEEPEILADGAPKAPNRGGAVGIDANALYYSSGPVILVGAEYSMPALSRVIVANPERSNWEGSTDVDIDGSFNLPVNASVGDTLDISALLGGVVVDSIVLYLELPSVDAYAANEDVSGALDADGNADPTLGGVDVSVPDAQGVITVAGITLPGITVVVANVTRTNSTAADALIDGSFTARLRAYSGDQLALFVVEPAVSQAGPAPLTAFVPY